MSLNIRDLGLRQTIADIIEDLQAGIIYVARIQLSETESDFEIPERVPTLISQFPFFSLKEKKLLESTETFGDIIDGHLSLKTGTTEESRLAKTGDYVFIDVAEGYRILKGKIEEIKSAKMSTIMEFRINPSEDVPFYPSDINLNLLENL